LGATGATGAQGAQGATGPPAGVTCYNFDIWVDASDAVVCAGFARRESVWSELLACSTIAGCYYLDQTNCENQGPPDLGATFYACVSGVPPDFGELDATGCNVGSGGCRPSDERLKKGIETLTNSLQKLMMINAVEYDWNSKLNEYEHLKEHDKLHTIGLIAQEIKEYFPEVVSINPDGYYWIDYSILNAVLVEAIKEQQLFIEEIDKELEFIESKLI
jgi:hypothetical protein